MPVPTLNPETGFKPGGQLERLYHVILLNDEDHTYEYVVVMLGTLFFMPPAVAFDHAVEVDTTGRTIVITCEREHSEFARDQIHAYGADPRMERSKGPMSAIIEQVYSGPG
jgi:ATP-dependent Clp protease adaptor protein ClpS